MEKKHDNEESLSDLEFDKESDESESEESKRKEKKKKNLDPNQEEYHLRSE